MTADIIRAQTIEIATEALARLGLDPLLSFEPLKRLGRVSFLGIVNEVYNLSNKSDRYEHTLSVVLWADKLCQLLAVPNNERKVILCTYLLHDLGHGPFSHNSEPFMLECMRVYHQGLGSLFLKQGNRFGKEAQTLKDMLNQILGVESDRVMSALMKDHNNGDGDSISEFVSSPINIDKIEGNWRSGSELVSPCVTPEQMLNTLAYDRGRFYVRTSALETIIQFWRSEKKLYWEKLYTDSVFGAEAVLTRVLHLLHQSGIGEESLVFATDDQILEMAGNLPLTRLLCERLLKGEVPQALSASHPELYLSLLENLNASRFDFKLRAEIEATVAIHLGVKSDMVISHFSRRKYFDERFNDLFQAELFEHRADLIPLSRIRSAFSASKRSGDLVDIYYFKL